MCYVIGVALSGKVKFVIFFLRCIREWSSSDFAEFFNPFCKVDNCPLYDTWFDYLSFESIILVMVN